MNKKFLKRAVALAMAATMVLGNAVVAFAADGTATGRSTYEGVVKPANYLQITVPTVAATDQFDFIADPNGLIDGVSKDELGYTISGTDTGVYFATGTTLKSTSEPIEVTNENYSGTYIDAELKINTAGSEAVSFATGSTWAGGVTAKELYLALQDKDNPTTNYDYVKADGTAAKIGVLIPGKPANFTTSFTTKSAADFAFGVERDYFVTQKAAGQLVAWEKAGFQLFGAINKNASWTQSDLSMPKIGVTWTFAQQGNATVSVDASTGLITVAGMTADQNYASLRISRGSETYELTPELATFNLDDWTATEGGTVTAKLVNAWTTLWAGDNVTVEMVLSDGSSSRNTFTMPASFS